ncbi:unnamed protein product [Mucor hiemalis]
MLHHLVADIERFGMPVHYETEHGEQFNKFIREEILRTNRHNPSRDLAVAFAKKHSTAGKKKMSSGEYFSRKHAATLEGKRNTWYTKPSARVEDEVIEKKTAETTEAENDDEDYLPYLMTMMKWCFSGQV